MARGKYKSTAEARRVRETALQEAQRLRRENDALRRENESLSVGAMAQHAAHLEQMREMRLALASVAEPELIEARRELASAREEIDKRKEGFAVMVGAHRRTLGALQTALEQMGMTEIEAYEQTFRVSKFVPTPNGKEYVSVEDLTVTAHSEAAIARHKGGGLRVVVSDDSDWDRRVREYQALKGLRRREPVE